MIIICSEHFFEAAQTGILGTVIEHETGNSTAKAEQNAVRKEINTEDANCEKMLLIRRD
jgi:cytidine deaminase